MSKTMGRSGLHQDLAMVMTLFVFGCTGVASVPGGGGTTTSPGGPTTTPGGNTMTPGGTTSTPGGGVTTGGPSGASLWNVTPTTTLDSGRVVLRRLNRTEFNNTVRDLLGTMTTPADKFPADGVNDGFDTLGGNLAFSDLLAENMETAAGALIDELLGRVKTDPLRMRVLSCEPAAANLSACMTTVLTSFMTNAYRRPATAAEVSDMVALATSISTSSGDPLRGVNAALKAVLLSPHFLFHVEGGNGASAAPTPLTDYELASRLSYFLWSTMPDPTLTQAAVGTKLSPAGADFTSQLNRMIMDPKAQAFVDNFGGQWLQLRDVPGVAPDSTMFAGVFDDALRLSMVPETSTFFASLIQGSQPLTTLLTANFSFVNGRIAKFYGISGVPATQTTFTKATLPANQRMGLLTQESFLAVTSLATRTSPVIRGNWILEHILCDETPPPPPGIKPLVPPQMGDGLTERVALAMHRALPACATCHNTIDPMGLAFENYDAIGAYRTMDNGQTVDATGAYPDGTPYDGGIALSNLLAKDPRFTRCMTKQVMTYAVGRTFDKSDAMAYVAGVADPLVGKGTWPDLLRTVASSQAFLTRRGEGP